MEHVVKCKECGVDITNDEYAENGYCFSCGFAFQIPDFTLFNMKPVLNVILLIACLYAVVPAIILTIDHLVDPSDSIVNKIVKNIKG